MPPFDLVIFDCDGTLVDSERLNNDVTATVLAQHHLPQCDLAYCLQHFSGFNLGGILAKIRAEFGVSLSEDQLRTEITALTQTRLATGLNMAPGAMTMVQTIADRLPVCVASNGERPNVLRMLHATGLDAYLPERVTFTANMVANPKPAPDLYLYAAAAMGHAPARSLVVEDSVAGARAGLAAGMIVLGYTGVHHDPVAQTSALRAIGVDLVTDDLSAVTAYALAS